jgi:hypothetical protein
MNCVAGLACVAALQGDLHSAGHLWGISEAAEKRLWRILTSRRAVYEPMRTPLQDDHSFQAGYNAGLHVDLAQAVRELRTASYGG